MGTAFIVNKLENNARVASATRLDDKLFEVIFRSATGATMPKKKAYVPSPDQYLVGEDVIDDASEKQADLLVAEPWCHLTIKARQYGERRNVAVLTLRDFLEMVDRGQFS